MLHSESNSAGIVIQVIFIRIKKIDSTEADRGSFTVSHSKGDLCLSIGLSTKLKQEKEKDKYSVILRVVFFNLVILVLIQGGTPPLPKHSWDRLQQEKAGTENDRIVMLRYFLPAVHVSFLS